MLFLKSKCRNEDQDKINVMGGMLKTYEELIKQYEDILSPPPFTTIGKVNEDEYKAWLRQTDKSDLFRYLVYEIRENTLREMVGVTDGVKLLELNSRLSMLSILTSYVAVRGQKSGK